LGLAELRDFDAERFLKAFQADKKHSSGHYHLIVPTSADPANLGVEEIRLPANQASVDAVLLAMQQALTTLESELVVGQSVEVAV
jgi:3-dehydroquinate synthase